MFVMGTRSDTLTSHPEDLEKVQHRKAYIAYAMDRMCVPMDGYTPAAMLDIAFFIANSHGRDPKWICKMLRDYANTIEAHYAPMDGPKQ